MHLLFNDGLLSWGRKGGGGGGEWARRILMAEGSELKIKKFPKLG